MKIFPIKPMSNYDRLQNIMDIIHNVSVKTLENKQNLSSDVITLCGNKPLNKGKSV